MKKDFDIAVIGGGAAGLTAAGIAVNLGAKTLLVERDRLGGDCTWTGCVPSKTLLHVAGVANTVRTASELGIESGGTRIDFRRVMEVVRQTRQQIYDEADAPEVYESMGVTVMKGTVSFADKHTLSIDDNKTVTARHIVIATGAAPVIPPIEGIDEVGYLTSETLFEIEEQPGHLIVIGAGPVGIEMAQAFRRLGSKVTVLDAADRILKNDDLEAAAFLQERLEKEGVEFLLGVDIKRVQRSGQTVSLDLGGHAVTGDAVLVATGRRPNNAHLNLGAAGVELDDEDIRLDDRGRTSVSHIYVAGDASGGYAFTHMAEHTAKTAVMNALLKVPSTFDRRHVPWVTYTDPELAHVGATKKQLDDGGTAYESHRFPYDKLDRAITDRASYGFITIYAKRWSGKILGASIVGARAGDLISEVAVAMRNGVSLRRLSDTIHPYPSYGLGVRRAADQWYVRRRSPMLVKTLRRVFGYRGPVIEYGPDDVL